MLLLGPTFCASHKIEYSVRARDVHSSPGASRLQRPRQQVHGCPRVLVRELDNIFPDRPASMDVLVVPTERWPHSGTSTVRRSGPSLPA